ncbi:MAG TPA: FHA domain-containing protein, partial [Ktedonobacteraceae bacterium]
MEKKCPYCGAETRPGDNYCLNCGNPLPVSTPSSSEQAQPATGDATQVSPEDWPAPAPGSSQPAGWPEASAPGESYGYQASYVAPTVQATMDRIDQPARLILRSDNGDIVQEYPLDKPEITIGRAQSSDILLSKDKLTSRRHATIQYENSQYVIRDEHSANGTFVNGQQIEEMVPHSLQDGDHVGIGEHELIFH